MNINVPRGESLNANPLLLLQEKSEKFRLAARTINKYYIGQPQVTQMVMLGVISGGHVLLEGPPGTGKTRLSEIAGKVLGMETNRIQFTSDMMPADIIGFDSRDPVSGAFNFNPGPLFGAQLLHADEINRASPKTQSGLLEAMQERSVTLIGKKEKRPLDKLFTVIATQNPTNEAEGTMPLPRAMLDRFVACVHVPHLSRENAKRILEMPPNDEIEIETVLDDSAIGAARSVLKDIVVPSHVSDYILDIDRSTWDKGFMENKAPYMGRIFNYETDLYGHSERGGMRVSQSLRRLAQASAFLRGDTVVEIGDVQPLVVPTLIHRLGAPRFVKKAQDDGPSNAPEALHHLSLDMAPGHP